MASEAGGLGGGRHRGDLGVSDPAALLFVTGAVSAVVSWAAVRMLIPVLRSRVVDEPNERSSHSVPTPRGGGIGVIAGVAAGVGVALWTGLDVGPGWYWCCVALAALLGLMDDTRGGLSPGLRFLAQIVLAGVAVGWAGPLMRFPLPAPLNLQLGVLGYVAGVVWIVGVINIYNFLDGIDGYASVQGIVAALGSALIIGGVTQPVGTAVAGGCAGFLVFNWHPAKVFLGDVGSGFLGAVLALLPFTAPPAERSSAVLAVALCLWFFLADGTLTLAMRAARKERLWQAHRSHLYQRLTRTGLNHAHVVLSVIPAAILVVGVTWLSRGSNSGSLLGRETWVPLGLALLLTGLMWLVTVIRERSSADANG